MGLSVYICVTLLSIVDIHALTLNVKDALVGPAVLIITDELAGGIGRQCRLSSARKLWNRHSKRGEREGRVSTGTWRAVAQLRSHKVEMCSHPEEDGRGAIVADVGSGVHGAVDKSQIDGGAWL
jgi:hypothetical protein